MTREMVEADKLDAEELGARAAGAFEAAKLALRAGREHECAPGCSRHAFIELCHEHSMDGNQWLALLAARQVKSLDRLAETLGKNGKNGQRTRKERAVDAALLRGPVAQALYRWVLLAVQAALAGLLAAAGLTGVGGENGAKTERVAVER
jgi:hypothetical protein